MEIQLRHATVTSLPQDSNGVRPVHISSQKNGSIQLYGEAAEQFTKKYAQEFQSKTASQDDNTPSQWNDIDVTLDFDVKQLASGHSSGR